MSGIVGPSRRGVIHHGVDGPREWDVTFTLLPSRSRYQQEGASTRLTSTSRSDYGSITESLLARSSTPYPPQCPTVSPVPPGRPYTLPPFGVDPTERHVGCHPPTLAVTLSPSDPLHDRVPRVQDTPVPTTVTNPTSRLESGPFCHPSNPMSCV